MKQEESDYTNAGEEFEQKEKEETKNKKSVSECLTVKPLQNVLHSHDEDQGSPSYPIASAARTGVSYHMRTNFMPGYGGSLGSSGGSSGGAMEYGNIQRMWGTQQHSPTSTTNNNEGDLNLESNASVLNELIMDSMPCESSVQVQMQPNMRTLPRLFKQVEKQHIDMLNRRLSGSSAKTLTPRRGSNASVGSVDSTYMSGTDSYTSSRRGSDNSIQSFRSAGGRSGTLASPMPSRNLSPRCINQTLIEGEVLKQIKDHSPSSCTGLMELSNDIKLRDVNNSANDYNQMNRHSRVSSGYGSQTMYFPSKSPARASPAPSATREVRRASEGTVKRVSDFNTPVYFNTHHRVLDRRGSAPTKVASIIDNTPRRHSMSGYNLLPLSPAMQKSISDDTSMMIVDTKPNINDTNPGSTMATSTSTIQPNMGSAANILQLLSNQSRLQQPKHDQMAQTFDTRERIYGQNNLVVLPRNNSGFQQQQPFFQTKAVPQDFSMPASSQVYPTSVPSQVIHVAPDSTMSDMTHTESMQQSEEDPLSSFVENYRMPNENFNEVTSSTPTVNQLNETRMHQSLNQTVNQNIHQNIMLNQPMINQNQVINQNQQRSNHNQILNQQNQRLNHMPDFTNSSIASFMHPHIPQPPPPVTNQNFDMTLQWRNNHFVQKQVEPDSTADKVLEDMMIQRLTGLTTETCESRMSRPPTNMVINTMDTLLTSFAEENKYFENQTFNRYP